MTGFEWLFASVVVAMAAGLQAATGAGLGLIAGPVLILTLESSAAIHVAILLNLIISVLMIRSEARAVNRPITAWLSLGTVIGIPAGVWLLNAIDLDTLSLIAGICVSVAAIELALRRRRVPAVESWTRGGVGAAGVVSGWMTGAMAIPGPAAMWQLARTGISAPAVRASLRAQYCVAYAGSLLVHAAAGMQWPHVAWTTLLLMPALAMGGVLGGIAKHRMSDRVLSLALLALLIAMGGSLLINGLQALRGW